MYIFSEMSTLSSDPVIVYRGVIGYQELSNDHENVSWWPFRVHTSTFTKKPNSCFDTDIVYLRDLDIIDHAEIFLEKSDVFLDFYNWFYKFGCLPPERLAVYVGLAF